MTERTRQKITKISFTLEDLKTILNDNKEDMKKEMHQMKNELKDNTSQVIKLEVEKVLGPVAARQDDMEKQQTVLTEKVNELTKQMTKLQEGLEGRLQESSRGAGADSMASRLFGRRSSQEDEVLRRREARPGAGEGGQEAEIRRQNVKQQFSIAKKTLGMSPIDKQDIERFMKEEHGGLNEEESKVAAVKEYFEMEMRMKPEVVEEVMKSVEKVFEPKKQDWNTLYVSFSSEAVADKVLRHTQYMKKGKGAGRVQHYVPRALYARFRAFEKRAAEMRFESNKSINTRVAFQDQDFKLLWRQKNQKNGWNVEPNPEYLPGFQLDNEGGTLQSPARTPPQGRERYREQCQEAGEGGAGSREVCEGDTNKRPHSPADQGDAKRSREEEQGRGGEILEEQDEGMGPGSSRPLVQVDIHPPGSPGLGLQNRQLFDHVTLRKNNM